MRKYSAANIHYKNKKPDVTNYEAGQHKFAATDLRPTNKEYTISTDKRLSLKKNIYTFCTNDQNMRLL